MKSLSETNRAPTRFCRKACIAEGFQEMEKTHSKPHTKVMPPTISCGREYLVTKTFTEVDVIFLLAKQAYEVV